MLRTFSDVRNKVMSQKSREGCIIISGKYFLETISNTLYAVVIVFFG